MARRLLPLTVLLLLAVPGVHAAPPHVGYTHTTNPADSAVSLPAGTSHTYNFSVHLAPATDDTTVDLTVSFSDFRSLHPAAIAPLSEVWMRRAGGTGGYSSIGFLSGFTQELPVKGLSGGEYKVQVVSSLDPGLSLGEHPSFLGFTVSDPDVRSSTATASYEFGFTIVPPPNGAPTARFTHSVSGATVSFDASSSTDPDGDPLAFLWEFGDGGVASGPTPTHEFLRTGTFNVQLRATDDAGAFGLRTVAVSVTLPGGSGNTGNTGGDGGGNTGGNAGPLTPLDTDGDTFSDEVEAASGSDPANRLSVPSDRDGDGRANEADNCPAASNADQADGDGDGLGDACDLNANDGPTGDPDGDGRPSSGDNCPGLANADQLDLDGDGRGDACDTDIDGDSAVNEADAFPLDPKESRDNDGDLLGDNADPDDDNDLIPDRDEAADGSDPLDRHDPPWLASAAVALRVNGTNRVSWTAPADDRIQRFLVWREASPYVLLATVPADGSERYGFVDDAPPLRARYHIQAQLDGMTALAYAAADDRATNWVSALGALADGCDPLARDTDKDGLCDVLERQMGLDPAKADTDGDGLKDGDELLGASPSLPMQADSDGDGRSDSQERRDGTSPLAPDQATGEPKEGSGVPGWLWPTLILAGAVVVAALILRPRAPKPPQT